MKFRDFNDFSDKQCLICRNILAIALAQSMQTADHEALYAGSIHGLHFMW